MTDATGVRILLISKSELGLQIVCNFGGHQPRHVRLLPNRQRINARASLRSWSTSKGRPIGRRSGSGEFWRPSREP